MQLSDIELLLSSSALSVLKKPTAFGAHLRQALAEINSATGESIAEDFSIDSSNDWIITPLAWMLEHSATATIAADTPEHASRVESNYKRALEILERHKLKAPKGKKAVLGTIEGMYE